MKKLTLLQWGLCFIFGGVTSNVLLGRQTDRSAALGQGMASLLLVIVGIVLILMHVLRFKRPEGPK